MGSGGSCASGGGGWDYEATNTRLGELYDQVTSSTSKGGSSCDSSNFISFVDTCERMGVNTGLSKETPIDTCMTDDNISLRLTELSKKVEVESRLEELYSLVESETSAKKTLEEDFKDIVFSEEVSIKPNTFGILEDIIMEDEEQRELTIEEFREYLGEFSYLSEQLEEEHIEEVSDLEKLIEEIKSSKKETQTGLLLGRTFELLGSKFCSKYGSFVSSICGNMGKDLGEDIGNTLDPIVQNFIKNFEKAKEEGKSNKEAILLAIQ